MNKILIQSVIHQRPVYQQSGRWFVLDEEFKWDLPTLQKDVFACLNKAFHIPIIFCDSCEANKIVSALGEEEAECLQFASGVYWREVGIIFIFKFEDYLPLVETIFHELRHYIQDHIPYYQKEFELDKKRPYEERTTEQDAFAFAAYYLAKFTRQNSHAIPS